MERSDPEILKPDQEQDTTCFPLTCVTTTRPPQTFLRPPPPSWRRDEILLMSNRSEVTLRRIGFTPKHLVLQTSSNTQAHVCTQTQGHLLVNLQLIMLTDNTTQSLHNNVNLLSHPSLINEKKETPAPHGAPDVPTMAPSCVKACVRRLPHILHAVSAR